VLLSFKTPNGKIVEAKGFHEEIRISTVHQKAAAPRGFGRAWPRALRNRGFHLQMACAATGIVILEIAGCTLTSIRVPNAAFIPFGLMIVFAIVQLIPLYWHTKGKREMRDAALVILWALLIWAILPFETDVAARLAMSTSLQDANLARIDGLFGLSVPSIVRWTSGHWVGTLINRCYKLLVPFLWVAFLLPSLTGKVKKAQEFLLANVVACVLGDLIFAFLPAVGPWYGYHLPPGPGQAECQADLFELRTPGLYVHHPSGVVCFPSFHVFWAILCAQTLWYFKPLRIPSAILCGLIVLSTMTTGWHYFSDVLGGALTAALAIFAAQRLSSATARAGQQE
jgi:membrane-associated phospholipid phosphatase